ncbi:uncharacterized protein LOC123672218 [Harmonia axyridis]|uniref:uncharacterized protein LOC123672218 n=1 Tax=Harmonia axyridis TaxID=115357 RepID=UPI001E2784F5|nr:uncharacterized protein LOC123672218 [Harmonia axyridis]
MSRVQKFVWILMQFSIVLCDFEFPSVKLEAFEPEGFRVTVGEMDDINVIGFHANKNKQIDDIEPGEISVDIRRPSENGWSYFNPNLKLEIGDKIYYWIFLQHQKFGYKKPRQSWIVNDLIPLRDLNKTNCRRSITQRLGPTRVCEKELIFDSLFFDGKVNEKHWKIAHYIPSFPDFEFCSYQKKEDILFIKDHNLVIKPIPATKLDEVSGTLDLREGCTSHSENDCIAYEDSGFILPPVRSGKMKTNENFKYGTVEIKAKLPVGDWIYPEIYLESSTNKSKKIWIAYARGNQHLYGNGGEDIGGTLLFGGPMLTFNEPDRSKHLSSSRGRRPFSESFHKYSVLWEPDQILLYVDEFLYGEIKRDIASLFNETMHVVLGVGVGGLTDFPDYYVSTNNKRKPWKETDRLINKKFFKARDDWLPTWTNDGSSLKVEYVKIWALVVGSGRYQHLLVSSRQNPDEHWYASQRSQQGERRLIGLHCQSHGVGSDGIHDYRVGVPALGEMLDISLSLVHARLCLFSTMILTKTHLTLTVLVLVFVCCHSFDVPEAKFEIFRPKGFKVSIPDVDGIKLFAFHAKLNEEMNGREGGTFSRDITKAKNGRWTFSDPYTVLNVGDTLYYWTYVDYFDGRNKLGYTNDDREFTVTAKDIIQKPGTSTRKPPLVTTKTPDFIVHSSTIDPVDNCDASITKYNNGIRACKGQPIFSEDFNELDSSKWTPEVKFAGEPDYEFVIYTSKPEVLKVADGRLLIKPVLSSSLFGRDFETSPEVYNLGSSCTGKLGTSDCYHQASDSYLIKPPVASAQITTKSSFNFLYGKIEVKAKLPKGDWIYPELYLNPKNEEYGENFQSGQIRIAFLPGNSEFSKVVYGGCILGTSNGGRTYGMKTIRRTNSWSDDFHRFGVEWSNEKITLSVNDNIYGHIYPPQGGFASLESQLGLENCDRWRNSHSGMAPFDKEMYITIGVGVGGYSFPDGDNKPWSNDDPKMQKKFYKKKSQWHSTWNDKSVLEVEHVKVYAL